MSGSGNRTNQQNNRPCIEVVALALYYTVEKKYLMARRGPGGSGSGNWEFPGGKIEVGETQKQALRREIIEELGFDLAPFEIKYVGENRHQYENKDIKIYLWRAEVSFRPDFQLVDHDEIAWCNAAEIKDINLSEGDKYFISLI